MTGLFGKRGGMLLFVLILVAAISISLPYLFRATTFMLVSGKQLKSKKIAESANLSALDFVDELLKLGVLLVETQPEFDVEKEALFTTGPNANWAIYSKAGPTPPTLVFYSCDPRKIASWQNIPSERDCYDSGDIIRTQVSFFMNDPNCQTVRVAAHTIVPISAINEVSFMNAADLQSGLSSCV